MYTVLGPFKHFGIGENYTSEFIYQNMCSGTYFFFFVYDTLGECLEAVKFGDVSFSCSRSQRGPNLSKFCVFFHCKHKSIKTIKPMCFIFSI